LQPLGIAATVIDAYALPLDAAPVLGLARSAGAPILTVEDSYVGGIGNEIAEAAAAYLAKVRMGTSGGWWRSCVSEPVIMNGPERWDCPAIIG
jgi:transketolase C-terminal domain/subunit